MRKNIFISIIASLALSFTSCSDYLDMEHFFKDQLDLQDVFESRDYSEQWLAGVYTHLIGANADVASKGHTPFNLISDDMFFGDRDDKYRIYKNGEYDEGWNQETWGMCYEGIRDASTFIHNIDINKEMSKTEIADYKAQARFLRAYYYWLLLRKYGPVPILPDEGVDFTQEYADLSIPRNTYEECADFITSELALAAIDLPIDRSNRNTARPTKGAALAARAKVYLFSASPLFNGNTDKWADELTNFDGTRLISATYDEKKWAKAAAAAKDVMDLGVYELYTAPFRSSAQGIGKPATIAPPYDARYSDKNYPEGWANIDPFESYRSVFDGDLPASSIANKELIFTRDQNQSGEGIIELVRHQMPYSAGGVTWNTHGLTLKMFDAYYMNNGEDFMEHYNGVRPTEFTVSASECPPLPAKVSKQNAFREPRFYASVAYNGSLWEYGSILDEYNTSTTNPAKNVQIFYYRGTQDGKVASAPAFHIRTGIGIKKYYNPMDSFDGAKGGRIVPKAEPAIRYAEVLLIYVEALNELNSSYTLPTYDGKGTITVSRNTAEMSKAISQIRIRAGLPDFAEDVYADAGKYRTAVKRERQIELMGEGHRYYDLRRWKEDARIEESMPVRGFNMNMSATQREQFNIPIDIPSLPSVFVDRMYLWPISLSELKRNKNLVQNPGWKYYD
ncbi:MAG: RagB/SusD family nutrient uptake outer membrane protein [Candidatus Symbiothrix sp.]|jgi:hypothetical protein|nr:RagB/SusD family nutrient uptake outer membrane protein [Candidatus Symbiothrix sp.]